ncbi:MAG: hypothetical protein ACMZI0_11815 [Symbiopectobacterium sp.]|uniref:hypothetical protein n=1 Tax=Symbiopectobacterium sp. TaxID=2952789 RepID=UPI0039EB5E3F
MGCLEILESEYQRDISIINQLAVTFFDDNDHVSISSDNSSRQKRSARQPIIKNKNIVNEIISLMEDDKIDWRLRNEFDLIFRRAESSADIKK